MTYQPTDSELAEAMRWGDCGMAVTRMFEMEPCGKPAAGVIVYEFDGAWFASSACAWHTNAAGAGAAVPLHRLLDLAWRQSYDDEADHRHAGNPYGSWRQPA